MDMRRRRFNALGLALAGAAVAPRVRAQGPEAPAKYPSRPIRLLIPFAVGGGTDIIGREIARQMTLAWKQSVVVENRAGGNSTIGLEMAAKSEPDGYTLTMMTASATVNVTLQGHKQPYNLLTDFAPISRITSQPYVLVINPDLPVRSVKDLIALAGTRHAKPMTYGSSGIGVPGYNVAGWYGMLAPAHTPAPIVAKLNKEIVRIVALPEVAQRMAADGSEPTSSSADAFRAHIRAEVERWQVLIKKMGIPTE